MTGCVREATCGIDRLAGRHGVLDAGPEALELRHGLGVGRQALDGEAWVAQEWIPGLERAARRYAGAGTAAQNAALQFALGMAHQSLAHFDRTVAHYERGVALLPNFQAGKRWLQAARANAADQPR